MKVFDLFLKEFGKMHHVDGVCLEAKQPGVNVIKLFSFVADDEAK